MYKLLVIAGTHYRENEFSHDVVDRLISHYGGTNPNQEFIGIDKARKAEIWDFKNISVAKIYKIGNPTKTFLDTLTLENLLALTKYKLENQDNGAEYAENFENQMHYNLCPLLYNRSHKTCLLY